ncbi:hypothetical protein NUBL22018_02790 [Klebsiella variicola]|uniref:pirin family protein n=1 Tax=Klebsiella variicola TaxID=244366 RepID=UPI0021816DF8|nr:pirin-like C-terminal cupin domain-containing protein [Klebsiella variicola]EKW2290597.1 pirin family protein [Klebsiella variicola]ELA3318771.1 pirin family protein [Klebsiella variicola]GKI33907.1 hypothetical protein NUBL22018_02790 [Klebsiella variicola]HCI8843492.1 pirin family protein [Klebsiella variicola]
MLKSRQIRSVVDTPMQPALSPIHRNRVLVEPGQWERTDPFFVLAEDWYSRGAFDNHPHRGIETFTYMVEGSNRHYDNHGNGGVIGPGEALWLTAGRGLIHNEIPADELPVHTLQLWINLPQKHKMVKASYQELTEEKIARRSLPGVEVRIFSGRSGDVVSATTNYSPVFIIELQLEPNRTFQQELPADFNGFLYVLDGEGYAGANKQQISSGQIVWMQHESEASSITMGTQAQPLRVLLIAGQPSRERIVAGGPFIMNSPLEIEEAFRDFRRDPDRFGLED